MGITIDYEEMISSLEDIYAPAVKDNKGLSSLGEWVLKSKRSGSIDIDKSQAMQLLTDRFCFGAVVRSSDKKVNLGLLLESAQPNNTNCPPAQHTIEFAQECLDDYLLQYNVHRLVASIITGAGMTRIQDQPTELLGFLVPHGMDVLLALLVVGKYDPGRKEVFFMGALSPCYGAFESTTNSHMETANNFTTIVSDNNQTVKFNRFGGSEYKQFRKIFKDFTFIS